MRRFLVVAGVTELAILFTVLLLLTGNPFPGALALLVASVGFLALCIEQRKL